MEAVSLRSLRRRSSRFEGCHGEKARALSESLKKRGAIQSSAVAEAFARVDRSLFLPASSENCAWDDAPLRSWDEESQCVVHLSAPSIYATALEALELGERMSFLNVGSGAGYLSALAATLLGKSAVHHCIEISAPLAARCRSTFEAIATEPTTPGQQPSKERRPSSSSSSADDEEEEEDQEEEEETSFSSDDDDDDDEEEHVDEEAEPKKKKRCEVGCSGRRRRPKKTKKKKMPFGYVPEVAFARVHVASCFELSVAKSMRFDRIYVGAGARASDARLLSRLLKPGGVIVGPFERDASSRAFAFGAQSLLRATREDEATFQVDELMAVQFAPLSRRIFDADGRLVDLAVEEDAQAADADDDDDGEEPHQQQLAEDDDDDDREEEEEEEEAPLVVDASTQQQQDDAAEASAASSRPPPQQLSEKHAYRTFVLRGPTWGVDNVELFSPSFLQVVGTLRKVAGGHGAAARLPWHVWQDKILSLLAHDDVHDDVLLVDPPTKKRPCLCGSERPDNFRLNGNAAGPARRSLAIARAVARWTLSRLT